MLKESGISYQEETSLVDLPESSYSLVETTFDEKVLEFEVFENYMALVLEKNKERTVKVVNLRNESFQDIVPTFKDVDTDFYDVELEDNHTFDTPWLKYRLTTPNRPETVTSLNMGTKVQEELHTEHFHHFKPENYVSEKIMVPTRENFEIPVIMTYNKHTYTDSSPWVIYTKGAES
jgi:protease II